MDSTESGQIPEAGSAGGASDSDQGSEQHPSNDNGSSSGNGSGSGGESRTDDSDDEDDEDEDETSDEETDEAEPSVSRRDKGKGRYVFPLIDRDEALARAMQAAEYSRMDDPLINPSSSTSAPPTIEPRPSRFAPYTSREVASITSRLQRRTRRDQAANPGSLNPNIPFPWTASAHARGPLAHRRDTEAILAITDAFLDRQPQVDPLSATADSTAYLRNLHDIISIAIGIYRRAVPEYTNRGRPMLDLLMTPASTGRSSTRPPARARPPVSIATVASRSRGRVRGPVTTGPVLVHEPGRAPRYVTTVRLSPSLEEQRPRPAAVAPPEPQQQQPVQEQGDPQHESPALVLAPTPGNPRRTLHWDMQRDDWVYGTASIQEARGLSRITRHMQAYLDTRHGPAPVRHPVEGFITRMRRLRSPERDPDPVYPVPPSARTQRPPTAPQRPPQPAEPAVASSSSARRSSYSQLVDPTPSFTYGSSRQWSPELERPAGPSSSYNQRWRAESENPTSSSNQGSSAQSQWYPESTGVGLDPNAIQQPSTQEYSESPGSSAQWYAEPARTSPSNQGSSAQSQWYPEPTSSSLDPYPIQHSTQEYSESPGSSAEWYAEPAYTSSSNQGSLDPNQWYSEPTSLNLDPYPTQQSSTQEYSESPGSSGQRYAKLTYTSSSIQESSAQSTQRDPQRARQALDPYNLYRSLAQGNSRPVRPRASQRSGGLESFYQRNPESSSSSSSARRSSVPWWYAHLLEACHPASGGDSATQPQPSFTAAESSSTLWHSGGQQTVGRQENEASDPTLPEGSFSTSWYPADPTPGDLLYGTGRSLPSWRPAYSQQGAYDDNFGAYNLPVGNEGARSLLGDDAGGEEGVRSHVEIFELDDHGQDQDQDQEQDREFLYLGDSASSQELPSESGTSPEGLRESDADTSGLLREPDLDVFGILGETDFEGPAQQQIYPEDAASASASAPATATAAGDRFITPSSSPTLAQELTLRVSSGGNSRSSQEDEGEEGEGQATAPLIYLFDSDGESSGPPPDQPPQAQAITTYNVSSTGTDDNDAVTSITHSLLQDTHDTTANQPLIELGDSSDHTSSTSTTTTTTTEARSQDYYPDSSFSPNFSSPSPPPQRPRLPHPRAQQRWNAQRIRALADDLDGNLASGETSSSDSASSLKRKRTVTPGQMSTRRTRVPESEDDEPSPAPAQHRGGSTETGVSTEGAPLEGSSSSAQSTSMSDVAEGSGSDHGSQDAVTTTPPLASGASSPTTSTSSPVTRASPPAIRTPTPPLVPFEGSSTATLTEMQPLVAVVIPVAGPRRSLRIRARDAARAQRQQEQQQALEQQRAQAVSDNRNVTRSSSSSTGRRGQKRGGAAMTRTSTRRGKR